MKLKEWIDNRSKQNGTTVTKELTILADVPGAPSLTKLKAMYYGAKIVSYDKAKAVSEYTRGAVTLAELCES